MCGFFSMNFLLNEAHLYGEKKKVGHNLNFAKLHMRMHNIAPIVAKT